MCACERERERERERLSRMENLTPPLPRMGTPLGYLCSWTVINRGCVRAVVQPAASACSVYHGSRGFPLLSSNGSKIKRSIIDTQHEHTLLLQPKHQHMEGLLKAAMNEVDDGRQSWRFSHREREYIGSERASERELERTHLFKNLKSSSSFG